MTSQSTANTPTPEQIRRAPKVLLHDHLDGGLRPGTVADLARETGYAGLPETDPDKLGIWFREAADSGSLERYLETFSHTVGVMQTRDALVRVARECAEDLAEDGVVYAEVRYAPEQHLEQGLTLEEVVEAVNEGFRQGEALAREDGRRIRVGALLTAMRHAARSLEIAELANRYRDLGVVGFDIAGAEAGYPPTRHLDAFEYLKRENNHENIDHGPFGGLFCCPRRSDAWQGLPRLPAHPRVGPGWNRSLRGVVLALCWQSWRSLRGPNVGRRAGFCATVPRHSKQLTPRGAHRAVTRCLWGLAPDRRSPVGPQLEKWVSRCQTRLPRSARRPRFSLFAATTR
ncbi:adenosine deaminase family protein [Streptomyces sp. NPDC048281]|uniref:adenosine deaminase family protein n=1 Tax=Streptomyces sp. NPDC048281 TaxID=3154715 RepID=UPI003430EB80